MAAPSVTSSVTLRSGEKQVFSHQIGGADGLITHEKLRESLQTLQQELNEYLTVQVDLEKGSSRQNNSRNEADEGEEEEDEDEDDTNSHKETGQGDQEPPQKKPKK